MWSFTLSTYHLKISLISEVVKNFHCGARGFFSFAPEFGTFIYISGAKWIRVFCPCNNNVVIKKYMCEKYVIKTYFSHIYFLITTLLLHGQKIPKGIKIIYNYVKKHINSFVSIYRFTLIFVFFQLKIGIYSHWK